MREEKIELPSGPLAYFHAGSGPPLLYLHPAGGVRRSRVLEGLAGAFSLYVPVFPGFEATALHESIRSRRQLAALVAQFWEKVVGERCDVMGWSFGGAVAMWLAIDHPRLVERLVLECPAGLWSIDRAIKRVNRPLLERYGADDGKDEEVVMRVGEIAHRTLIIQGTADRTIPPPSAELLKGKLRNPTLAYVPQAGHDLEMDQPASVLALVRNFLG